MACESCGEKQKNTAKDFTKAVVEIDNPEEIVLFRKVVVPSTLGDETTTPPAIGKYKNILLVYEINNHAYLYSSDGVPTNVTIPGPEGPAGRDGMEQYTAGTGIDITGNVISVTGTTGAVWGAITGTLSNQTDLQSALNAKQATLVAGANISIDSSNEISATDTTYSNFVGTDGVDAGTSGLVPAPAATDASKFLRSDGTWATAGGGGGSYSAGYGIDITSGTISVDTSVIATQSDIPVVPTVNDSTITITNNGTTVDSFTTNTGSDKTIALSAPVITMTNVDPGEGSPLAANNFIAVY